jgi:hypothetical protein
MSVTCYPLYQAGGIGDVLRGAIVFYIWCKKNSIPFYFDFSAIPGLKECFEYPEATKASYQRLEVAHGLVTPDNQSITQLFEKIRSCGLDIRITANVVGYYTIDEVRNYIPFFNQILKPSDQVERRIRQVYDAYDLQPRDYFSVHVRCGDKYLLNNYKYCPNDKRIELDKKFIDYVVDTISQIYTREKLSCPIVFHTDSAYLRDMLKYKYITMPFYIQHTAVRPDIIDDNQGYIDTIAEFYIMARSCGILQFIYSGFSHWASIIGNTKLFPLDKSVVLEWSGDT